MCRRKNPDEGGRMVASFVPVLHVSRTKKQKNGRQREKKAILVFIKLSWRVVPFLNGFEANAE